jgi:hypothetical protein
MRWPNAWNDPSQLALLKGTPINHLIVERNDNLRVVVDRARQEGLKVAESLSPPSGVIVVDGKWPGVKMSETGAVDTAVAGPTGNPWVDSNDWKVRLTTAFHPGIEVWVDATPQEPRLFTESYLTALAETAAYGGRWIISLDQQLAAGIARQRPESLHTWKKITTTAGFFAARRNWSSYIPQAVLGIISDFSGKNEFFKQEILNLVARINQQYRIMLKSRVSESSLSGLKAVVYVDEEPPAPVLRKQIMAFVRAGGMLITGPRWGQVMRNLAVADKHPRYTLHTIGKGRMAVAKANLDDPYLAANDAAVLISYRYQLLRFWNGGAVGSFLTMSPDRQRAVVQMIFYASARGGDPSVRVVGRYRSAKLLTLDEPAPRNLEMEIQKDAVELHLPPVSQYAAVELEI